uniref:Mannose-6-phosphate isomerase n=1 Tax=Dendroctonus ponderosae TaxID=77166 RepID=J3JX02_DENPD|nr:unknown [Dendroctonus ponderosae]
MQVMELQCKVQNYEWGKWGSTSRVAQLQKGANRQFVMNEDMPYAELWMGTHVNAPSVLKITDEPLADVIKQHPEYLGEEVLKKFQELPFLFKVLSVNKALSIQAHPSKKHAEQLHAQFPDIYKDPNHKPEMAIALTPFEVLCGFRPWPQIKHFIETIPELQEVVGFASTTPDGDFIKRAFKQVLISSKPVISAAIDGLLKRFAKSDDGERCFLHADLVMKLHSEYPYDNGILMVYFLNYLRLKPSQALFLGANEPHAYLFGDCIECMACSDNVVRAGLTPKFVDVDTLCSMLIYEGAPPEEKLYLPVREDEFSVIFRPPIPDFAVVQIKVPSSETEFSTTARSSASILLIVSGNAQCSVGTVGLGSILFIPAMEFVHFTNICGYMLLYQALANV